MLKGTDQNPDEPELQPYVSALENWRKINQPKPILIDIPFKDEDLRFECACDVVSFKSRKEPILLGIKTSSSFSKEWPIHLAASSHLLNKHDVPVKKALILLLESSPKGVSLKPISYSKGDLETHWEMFKHLLDAYHHFSKT